MIYPRPDEVIFAERALAGEVVEFPDIPRGWGITFDLNGGFPPLEFTNGLVKRQDEAIRYLVQRGTPEWSATEDYPQYATVQESDRTWMAMVANTGARPSTSPAAWVQWGLTQSDVQRAAASFASAAGGGTAYTVTYLPAITTLTDGMPLRWRAAAGNTGEAFIKIDSLVERPLISIRHQPLVAGAIAAGSICSMVYSASLNAFVLTSASGDTTGGQDVPVVVGTPTVTGASTGSAGVAMTLTASATSLLAGGSIASFEWTLPDGSKSTTPATSGSATRSVTPTGAVGAVYAVTVVAIDNAGNRGKPVTKSITVSNNQPPTTPIVTVADTVMQGSTGNVLVASGSTDSDGDAVTYSISQSGALALVFSKTSGIASGEQVTFSVPAASVDTSATVNVVAVDARGGQSTPTTRVIAVSAVPSAPGTPFGGGYYFGRIKIGADTYALIVAPKMAEVTRQYATTATQGPTDWVDGLANTLAMATSAWPAAKYCLDAIINGFDDWYLGAVYEMEILYRNLKPSTSVNYVLGGSGSNPYSIPEGVGYTATSPAQTAAAAFKNGGSEALSTANSGYFESTSISGANNVRYIGMDTGRAIDFTSTTDSRLVRPIRRVKIG